MKVYIGYILGDYSCAVCMGLDENSVQKRLNSIPTNRPKWIEEYELNKNDVVELDCD